MSNLLPGPSGHGGTDGHHEQAAAAQDEAVDDAASRGSSYSAGRRAKSKPKHGQQQLPSREKFLLMLASLPDLLVTGYFTPAKANAVRAACESYLKYSLPGASAGVEPQLSDEDLLELLRVNPHTFNTLAPFLSEDRINMVMQSFQEADREPDEQAEL